MSENVDGGIVENDVSTEVEGNDNPEVTDTTNVGVDEDNLKSVEPEAEGNNNPEVTDNTNDGVDNDNLKSVEPEEEGNDRKNLPKPDRDIEENTTKTFTEIFEKAQQNPRNVSYFLFAIGVAVSFLFGKKGKNVGTYIIVIALILFLAVFNQK